MGLYKVKIVRGSAQIGTAILGIYEPTKKVWPGYDEFYSYQGYFDFVIVLGGQQWPPNCLCTASSTLYAMALNNGFPDFFVGQGPIQLNDKLYFSDDKYIYISYSNTVFTFHYMQGNSEVISVSYGDGQIVPIPWYCPSISTNFLQAGEISIYADHRVTSSQMPRDCGGQLNNTQRNWFSGFEPVDMDDPYVEIDDSEPSGPADGEGYPTDDPVPIPSLPTVSVNDTGFVTLFNPSLTQVKNLAAYMWAGLFDVASFKKIFADPMDCILGFNMLPVAVPNGGNAEVVVGNISTGVSMTKAAGQWVELDCGSVVINKPFGNYLDYSPYMKYSIYLPYIGTVDLSTDDIMGHTINLVYHIDVLSCACVAYLAVDGRVMYQWSGSCGYSIPVTGSDFRQMISNIVSIAATLGGAMVTGGMSAPMAAAAAAAGAATATNNVLNSKPDVHRSGAIGSSAGMLGMQKPYLILQGPRICKPAKQYHYLGYPAFVTVQVGSVSGYQEFSSVILDGIACTEEERAIIEGLLKGGVYI